MSDEHTHKKFNPLTAEDAALDRLTACVNACEGIAHPEHLPAVLALLGRLAEQADPECDGRDAGPCDEAGALLRALRGTF